MRVCMLNAIHVCCLRDFDLCLETMVLVSRPRSLSRDHGIDLETNVLVSSVLKFIYQGPDLDHCLSSKGLDLGLDLASKGHGLGLGSQGRDLGLCSQGQAIAVNITSSVYLCVVADCLCVSNRDIDLDY